ILTRVSRSGRGRKRPRAQVMEPPLGRTKPKMTLNRVVLPTPLGPIIPTTPRSGTVSDTLSRATRPPKRTLIPRRARLWPSDGRLADPDPRSTAIDITLDPATVHS